MSYFVLIRAATLSMKPLVLDNRALIVQRSHKIMVLPNNPITVRCNLKMFLWLRPTTVKCIYINYILNNSVLINFDISMAENVVVESPRPEDQGNMEAIPMVSTSALGK